MKTNGAPDDALKIVIDGFFDRQAQAKEQKLEKRTRGVSGFFSGIGRRVGQLSSMGEKLERRVTAPFVEGFGKENKTERQEFIKAPTAAEQVFPKGFKGTTPAEKFGATAFDIASILAGGGFGRSAGAATTSMLASQAPKGQALRPIVEKGIPFVAESIGGTTAFTASKEGRLPTPTEFGVGTAIDLAAPPIVSTLFGLTKKGLGVTKEIFKYLTNPKFQDISNLKLAGLSEATIKQFEEVAGTPQGKTLASFYEQAKNHVVNPKVNQTPLATVGDEIYTAFEKMSAARSEVGKQIGNMVKKATAKVDIKAIKESFTKALEDMRITPSKAKNKFLIGKDSFKGSGIEFSPASQKTLSEVFEKLQTMGDEASAADLWFLRKSVQDLMPSFKANVDQQVTEAAQVPLKNLNSILKEAFENATPEIKALNEQYSQYSDVVNFINRRIGPEGSKGAPFARNLLKDYDTQIKDMVQALGDFAGVPLLDNAWLAKAAMEAAGDQNAKGLLDVIGGLANPKGGAIRQMGKMIGDEILDKDQIIGRLLTDPEAQEFVLGSGMTKQHLNSFIRMVLKAAGLNLAEEL